MKIVWIALGGLALGMGAGTGVAALRVKGEILEVKAQAHADSLTAAGATAGHGEDGGVTVVLPPEEEVAVPDTATTRPEDHDAPDLEVEGTEVPTDSILQDQTEAGEEARSAHIETDRMAGDRGLLADEEPDRAPAALSEEGAKKLAKIFGAMKPVDAAAVMAGMPDDEVTAILVQMPDRQAGPVVSAFSAERAAGLSSLLLRARGGGL